MLKSYYLFLIICIAFFGDVYCQKNQVGIVELKYDKFFNKKPIKFYKYTIYKKPIKLPLLKEDDFNISQLNTPYTVAQSYVIANSNEWLNKLSEENNRKKFTPEALEYVQTNKFFKNYILEVYTEFSFVFEGNQYLILLLYSHNRSGENTNFPILLIRKPIGWKISTNQELINFSYFQYLNPTVLYNIFISSPRHIDGLGKYITGGIFQINQNFFYSYYSHALQGKNYLNATIPYSKPIVEDLKNDIVIENERPLFIAERKFQYSNLFTYNRNEYVNWYFSSQYLLADEGHQYDSLPEIALASWLFTKDLDEKRNNSIGFEKIEKDAVRYIAAGGITNRIEWLYKMEFYSNGIEYALIYFSEWFGKPNEKDITRGQWIGDKSVLMKKVNNSWVLVFDQEKEMLELQRAFDKLSLDGIKILLSGKKTGIPEIDEFLLGGAITYPPDHRIYLNDIAINSRNVEFHNPIPEQLKRGFGLKGIQDLKGDGALQYWMDR